MYFLADRSFEMETSRESVFNIQVMHSIPFPAINLLVPMLGFVEVPSVLLHWDILSVNPAVLWNQLGSRNSSQFLLTVFCVGSVSIQEQGTNHCSTWTCKTRERHRKGEDHYILYQKNTSERGEAGEVEPRDERKGCEKKKEKCLSPEYWYSLH